MFNVNGKHTNVLLSMSFYYIKSPITIKIEFDGKLTFKKLLTVSLLQT